MATVPDKSLKIVMIVTYTYPYIGSGIGNVALEQAEGLASAGNQVTLISSNVPATQGSFVKNGVEHIKLPANTFLERFHVPIPLFWFDGACRKKIREADIIHIHDSIYPSSFLAAILARIGKKPLILMQHVGYVNYPTRLLNLVQKVIYGTMGRFTISTSRRIIYINDDVRTGLGLDQTKCRFLPNGVNITRFCASDVSEKRRLRNAYALPLSKKIVLFVGRLVPKKGYDKLFQARDKGYLILFVGSGEVAENMKNDPLVKFMGPMPQEKLSEMYRLSDVFVLPSQGEGFPLSVQEAMATGLPVITSNDEAYLKYVDPKYVMLINPEAGSIKTAIEQVLSSPTTIKEMSGYSRKAAVERYSWEIHVKQLLSLYQEVLN